MRGMTPLKKKNHFYSNPLTLAVVLNRSSLGGSGGQRLSNVIPFFSIISIDFGTVGKEGIKEEYFKHLNTDGILH